MKISKHLMYPIACICIIAMSIISCEKDFVSIDSDVVNNDNATNFTNSSQRFNVKAYTKALDPIQTSNLVLYSLGVYNDPFYGKTTASIVTQVNSSVINPTFGGNPVLDSVVLTIPYFSRSIGITENNVLEFELDSVFGTDPIKLSIFENNFFLRSFDPNLGLNETQTYYANGATSASDFIDQGNLESTLIEVIDTLAPNKNLIVLTNEDGEVIETVNPAIRVKFNNLTFWQNKILDREGEPELSNQSNFNNFFRGLYFKAEPIDDSGSLMLLNLTQANANVTLYYKKDPFTDGNDRESATFTLTFTGNRVNFISNDFNMPLVDGDAENGDAQLFLKGGQGSIAALNLFDGDEDGNSTIFTDLKDFFVDPITNEKKRLINEANIVVYVDQQATSDLKEPQRLFLYDLTNKRPLIDIGFDAPNNTFPQFSFINHLGPLQTTEDGSQGIKYKFKITRHISNLLFNDSTNVKLGLAVSGNVNLEQIVQLNVLTTDEVFNKVPVSSIITPRGTILHGSQSPIEEKRIYLEVFYTEIENQ